MIGSATVYALPAFDIWQAGKRRCGAASRKFAIPSHRPDNCGRCVSSFAQVPEQSRASVSQGVMVRMVGLNQDSPRTITTAGASGHLRDELKGSFRRPEIRQRQSRVNRHNTDERYIRKIVAFR